MKTIFLAIALVAASFSIVPASEAKAEEAWICEGAYEMMTDSINVSIYMFGDESAAGWIRDLGANYFAAGKCAL